MRPMRKWLTAMITVAVVGLVTMSTASALDSALGDIEWGDDKETVLEKLRGQKLDEIRKDRRNRGDHAGMQRARQRVLDDMRRIEDSYTKLEGQRTGYEVSVITGEFTKDNNESVLRVRDDVAQRFYFFIDDGFYKLMVAYDPDHIANIGFSAFINRVRQHYGQPTESDYGRVQGQESMVRATWRDGEHELTVEDKRDYFGTYTMAFSDRDLSQRLRSEGREFGGSDVDLDDEGTQVSDRVRSLTQPGEHREANAAESMVGPVDVSITPSEQTEEEEEEQERAEEQQAEEEEAPSAPPARSSERQQESTTEESSDDADDLVIY